MGWRGGTQQYETEDGRRPSRVMHFRRLALLDRGVVA